MFVGSRDGKISLYNTRENYKLVKTLSLFEKEEEITCMLYYQANPTQSFLIIGSSTGQLVVVDLATQQICFKEQSFIASEITALAWFKGQVVAINND